MSYLFVGIGGIIGSLLRYYIGLSSVIWWSSPFPIATLVINLIGCFVLGWFTTYLSKLKLFSPALLTGFGTGLVGSFTTFSTFSVESVQLIQNSLWGFAILYVLSSLFGGLFFSYFGYRLGDICTKNRLQREGETYK
ncbi:fluoride efflux transporter CrcB [Heyndrickxia oleronia]|jgi:CrcB protein|uniref:Fluoride-specific ion channel FluC n=1 Tax=Heyndrickxia oleronia TaxID=38875 RepID=A0A8E2I9J1_9BACI|nr:fluoride efflux transporter CrcB [Heyndrickxia oleronia]OJH16919.1 camphor resistance protein CrcB [Bacillus obstructivus]MBU5211914.1 fluoride efflux transporter CrcB [Heyndrickxia oleronia]MCI1591319.1 fluoride efflux transporter CrcB [Heyndrickxia oleronia]MCI1613644.1 fluoride efflux transporter CrcB [Heyndrickxia oleronia]MCI1744774.1 fluoride efflux transporter CrcB [Heyndrickxia oleronia]